MKRLLPLVVVLALVCLLASAPARSADFELSVDPEVLQEMHQILNGFQVIEVEGIRYITVWSSPEEIEKAAAHLLPLQPASGNALVAIAVDTENPASMSARQMLNAMRDGLTWPQIETLLRFLPTAYVESLSHYPKGTASSIRTGYRRISPVEGSEIRTKSYKYLDGVAYGELVEYPGGEASTGGISVEKLGYGTHTAQAVTEYEVTYRGRTIKGRVESPVVTFEIIQDITPEIRAAPHDPELDRLVRRACRFVEVWVRGANANSHNPRLKDPWAPSTIMRRKDSPDIYAVHLPFLEVSEALPFDLSFDVELEVVETGEIFECYSIVLSKGRPGDGSRHLRLTPKDLRRFTKLEEGFIPIKAVLKSSRATALSNSKITQYYTGTLTSPVLRAKSYWFLQASAEPWLVDLQARAKELEGQGTASLRAMQWIEKLTSIDCYARSEAAFDLAPTPNATRTPPFPEEIRVQALPFLVALLQDDRTPLPTQPADSARDTLIAIGEPAVDPLIAALAHEEANVRARAAFALGRIAVARVVDPLIAALEDPERDVRLAAVDALGFLKDRRGVAPLQAALTDVAGVVRRGAAQALTSIEIHFTVVEFPDPGLEKAIRAAIDKPVGEIQLGDLVGVGFEKLYAARAKIEDLSGLEYCTDLKTLSLGSNAISNLNPLGGLRELQSIDLSRNQITDLTPLSHLTSLPSINISYNPLASIAPLSTMTGLTRLRLDDTSISDVTPLATLSSLKELYLRQNEISDIADLSKLGNLETLDLDRNAVADLSPLSKLDKLTSLNISGNQVSDLGVLSKLGNLRFLIADGNSITSLKPLAKLKQLRILNLSNNPIDDLRPLSKLHILESLYLARTNVVDLSILSTLTNLIRLDVTELRAVDTVDEDIANAEANPKAADKPGPSGSSTVDFSVLSPLANLTMFQASGNRIADMTFVGNFDHLLYLYLAGNAIEDIGIIAKMEELQSINFAANRISDIGVLSNLVHLKNARLDRNRIVDIGPLANQFELTAGTSISLSENPLNCESIQVHIPALKERGVAVYTDAVCVSSITPNFAPNSGSVTVVIEIETLEGWPSIALLREPQPPLRATSVETLPPGRIVCTFDLTGATPGALDLVVYVGAHGQKRGTIIGGFTVTDATSGI